MRFHWVVPERAFEAQYFSAESPDPAKHLFAYIRFDAAARACLLSLAADFEGHEAFYIVAPDTTIEVPSMEIAARHFPAIPLPGDMSGNRSFFNSSKAERLLGWKHG